MAVLQRAKAEGRLWIRGKGVAEEEGEAGTDLRSMCGLPGKVVVVLADTCKWCAWCSQRGGQQPTARLIPITKRPCESAGQPWGQRSPQGANLGSIGILNFLSKLTQWLPPAHPRSLDSQCMSGQPIFLAMC